MKKYIIEAVIVYISLHIATLMSLIPWFIVGLDLAEYATSASHYFLGQAPYFVVGFVISVILSVLILLVPLRRVSPEKRILASIIISLVYISAATLESIFSQGYIFHLPSSAYAEILSHSHPFVVIPVVYILITWLSTLRKWF